MKLQVDLSEKARQELRTAAAIVSSRPDALTLFVWGVFAGVCISLLVFGGGDSGKR